VLSARRKFAGFGLELKELNCHLNIGGKGTAAYPKLKQTLKSDFGGNDRGSVSAGTANSVWYNLKVCAVSAQLRNNSHRWNGLAFALSGVSSKSDFA
jgi:hypothetical protein